MEKKDFTAYAVGICNASICTSLPVAQATQRLNAEWPTGLDHGWRLSESKTFRDGQIANGAPCQDWPETHKHYLFVC